MKISTESMCEVKGCVRKHYAKGLCKAHYLQKRKRGHVIARLKNAPNEIFIRDGYAEIALYDKDLNVKAYAKIDLEDVTKLSKYHCHVSSRNYVYCRRNGQNLLLHRIIVDAPDGMVVDHINHNPLDNRKANLRVCTQKQNMQNLLADNSNTMTKGVHLYKGKYFTAYIQRNGKPKYLGCFSTLGEAAKARKESEKQLDTW